MIPSKFNTRTGTTTQSIDWKIYKPTGSYDRAVIIAYGSDGLTPQWTPEITRHATELAAEGILALIPDYFQKQPAVPHGNSEVVFAQIVQRHQEWSQVLRDAVVTAKGLPGIDPSRVGLIGMSLGGFLALRIRDEVNVLVEYFAPYRFPPNGDLGDETPLIGLGPNANARCKVKIHHGKADSLVPLDLNAKPIQNAIESECLSVFPPSFYQGANHGFTGNTPENEQARDTSLDETLAFFRSNL